MSVMSETEREIEMAQRGFGYGRWDAPYWFIGLEEGKGGGEPPGNSSRVEAWHKIQREGLCDCKEFHFAIREFKWHSDPPRLQSTWRPLILLLKTFLNQDSARDHLRDYQRDHWGRSHGQTCVIELSGTAAKGLAVKVDRSRFVDERIRFIREKMNLRPPTFVVMYGVTRRRDWKRLVEPPLEPDTIVKRDGTLFVMTPSPTAFGRKSADWISLARKLREAAGQPD